MKKWYKLPPPRPIILFVIIFSHLKYAIFLANSMKYTDKVKIRFDKKTNEKTITAFPETARKLN